MHSKQNWKKYSNLILFFLIISAPLLIFSSSLKAVAFDKEYYFGKFDELNVYGSFDEDKETVDKEAETVLDYLKTQEIKEIDSSFFNEKEKTHLVEVKDLIRKALSIRRFVFFFSLILLVFLIRLTPRSESSKRIGAYLIFGSMLAIIVAVTVSLFSQDFSSFFNDFHELAFKTETWKLDPETDNLINLFPEQLFEDISKKILSVVWTVSAISFAFGMLIYFQPWSSYRKKFIT
jgi:integral membrane protein (TIGR01906 family)